MHAAMCVSQEALQPILRVDLRVAGMTQISPMTTPSTIIAVGVKLMTNVYVVAAPFAVAAHIWSRPTTHHMTLQPGIPVGVVPTRTAKVARHSELRLPVNFLVVRIEAKVHRRDPSQVSHGNFWSLPAWGKRKVAAHSANALDRPSCWTSSWWWRSHCTRSGRSDRPWRRRHQPWWWVSLVSYFWHRRRWPSRSVGNSGFNRSRLFS